MSGIERPETVSRSAEARARSRRPDSQVTSGAVWALLVSGCVAAVVIWLKFSWVNHGLKLPGPDGSVLMSTFITLYGLFLGGFGVLGGFIRKASHLQIKVMAITFLVEATVLDLLRVLNSTQDLYDTTVGKLTFFQLHDDMHDFLIYFSLNVAVSAFALVAAVWPPRAATPVTVVQEVPSDQAD
jgi:hypothetical protein